MVTHDPHSRPAVPAARWIPAAVLAIVGLYALFTGNALSGAGWLLLGVAVAAVPFRRRRGGSLVLGGAILGAVVLLAISVARLV